MRRADGRFGRAVRFGNSSPPRALDGSGLWHAERSVWRWLRPSTLLLAGCGGGSLFGDPVDTSQTDTDAEQRRQRSLPHQPAVQSPGPGRAVYINKQETADDNSFSVLTSLFGDNNKGGGGGGGGSGVAVNSFLWHASLDTVSFMPLASADPFGGIIITDWYSPPDTPNERFKVNIFILGRELRADGVRVSVFRQTRDGGGQWVDAPVDPKHRHRSRERDPDARPADALSTVAK